MYLESYLVVTTTLYRPFRYLLCCSRNALSMNSANCLICNESLSSRACSTVDRGLPKVIDASKRRNDDLWLQLDGVTALKIHTDCRKHYTRETSIQAAMAERTHPASNSSSPVKKKPRSSADFSFEHKCLYCGEQCLALLERRQSISKRQIISNVERDDLKDTVLERCSARGNDPWACAVRERVESSESLVADGAKYHQSCRKRFHLTTLPSSSTSCVGRPPDIKKHEAIAKVCKFIEDDDECQYTLKELMKVAGANAFTEAYFKKQLQNVYGDKMVFTPIQHVGTIVTLRARNHEILFEKWRLDHGEDDYLQQRRIVEAASRIVREDIRLQIYNTSTYSSPSSVASSSEEAVPETLQLFLEGVIATQKKTPMEELQQKCTAIAHTIISATRPQSFVSSLLTGESCQNAPDPEIDIIDDCEDEEITIDGFDF